jgi:hypothetical protein
MWVLLPGLPLNFWSLKALMAIGNSIGRFIGVDEQALGAPDRKLGQNFSRGGYSLGVVGDSRYSVERPVVFTEVGLPGPSLSLHTMS